MRAMLLGLVHNANVGKLLKVHPQGNGVIHPLLYLDHRRVVTCLRCVSRSCMASDAGLLSRCAQGGVHLGLLPLVGRVGPSIGRDVVHAAGCLGSTTALCGRDVKRTHGHVLAPRNVQVRTLLRRPMPRTVLFRMLRPLKFGAARVSGVERALSKRPKGVFLNGK